MRETQQMCHLAEPYNVPHEVSAFIYIYIYIYWLITNNILVSFLSLFIKLNLILIIYNSIHIYLLSFILKFVHGRNIIFEFELFNSLA